MEKDEAQWKGHSEYKQAENIVLVGRTGNGKSATGNSLIGKKVFVSKAHASGVTMHCQTHEAVTGDGHTINVIDTPGLFDFSTEYISKEIVRCLTLAEGGIHAVLLVMSARTRITQEEEKTFIALQALFGSQILDYVIVVFTSGDVLEECNEALEDYLGKDCPSFLKEVLRMSGNRMVLFDNKTHDENKKAKQVHKLISLVDEIRKRNRGKAYTGDTYHEIKMETDKLRKKRKVLESKNNSEEMEEIMNRMSNTVDKKLRAALEAQEKALSMITNHVPLGNGGDQPIATLSVSVPPLNGFSCSIL